ncbi:MAG: molybdenum metabolism regulator [Aliarcobacter sp.]|nr:molybdenum metabolism regulator [Aliarcobacter sp.]
MLIILTRIVNNCERYYRLMLVNNLFGECIVERIFGSSNKLSPTGRKKNIFICKKDADIYVEKMIVKKIKKGYKILAKKGN